MIQFNKLNHCFFLHNLKNKKVNLKKRLNIKTLTTLFKILGVGFIIILVGFFLLRGYFLNKAIAKISNKFKTDYNATFKIEEANFKGISGIEFKKLSLVPANNDTILSINHFTASVRFWHLLIADVRIKDIGLSNGYLHLIKKGDYKNIEAFLPKKDTTVNDSLKELESEEKTPITINYAKVVYKLISKIFDQIPNEVLFENFDLLLIENENKVVFNLEKLSLNHSIFTSNINVYNNDAKQIWEIKGTASPRKKMADLNFKRLDSMLVQIPYLKNKFGLSTGFKSVRFQLDGITFEDEKLSIKGEAAIESLMINHARIAKKDVVINYADVKYNFLFGADFLSLDSTTVVTFNETKFHPYFNLTERKIEENTEKRAPRNKENMFYKFFNKYIVSMSVQTDKTITQKFINSLPDALFSHIKGMEATGSFSYRLDFNLDIHKPDNMVFESTISKDNLHITKYGLANIAKLNESFKHTPYERGRAMRSFIVGAENPNFVLYENISPYVKKAILTTEDPSFMYHRGFVNEAFRQSIAKNIRTGKFARGASTISMQLVKNVFLTREKTMARKLEEILLVYILENNYLVSKERMFEVYLNLIEWGPNVYGIGEASKFYFQKNPSELNLNEALYLASIVPSPKGFMYKFEKDGTMREYMERSFKFIANKMVSRSLILPEDTVGLTYKINITGPAKTYIFKNDSIVNDSIIIDETGIIENTNRIDEE
jgi:hypothetical protein